MGTEFRRYAFDSAVGPAGRAVGVLVDADRMEAGAQCVINKKRAVEAFAKLKQFLQHLDGLQGAEDAGDRAEDAGGLAARNEVGRRGVAEQAAVARVPGAEIRLKGRELTLERGQRRRHQRLFEPAAKIRQQVPRLEIVAAVGDK